MQGVPGSTTARAIALRQEARMGLDVVFAEQTQRVQGLLAGVQAKRNQRRRRDQQPVLDDMELALWLGSGGYSGPVRRPLSQLEGDYE